LIFTYIRGENIMCLINPAAYIHALTFEECKKGAPKKLLIAGAIVGVCGFFVPALVVAATGVGIAYGRASTRVPPSPPFV
jgi:hypothetical protein